MTDELENNEMYGPTYQKDIQAMKDLSAKLRDGSLESKALSRRLLEGTGMYDSQGNLLPQFDSTKNGQDEGYQPSEFEYVGINYGHNNG